MRIVLVSLFILLYAASTQAAEQLHDLPYGADPLQTLDVYLPAVAQDDAPVIVMVHGGAWRIGDKSNPQVWQRKVDHWGDRGAVFVAVNYRLMPAADPLIQTMDVARALAYVQDHAPEWGANPDRIALMGHSAGAHLVALLGADQVLADSQGARPWLGTVALDTIGYDIAAIMRATPSRLHSYAFGPDPDFWESASPMARLGADAAPFLLVCSQARDRACPEARGFADQAAALGVAATVLPQPMNHRALNAGLGAPGGYTDAIDAFLSDIGLWGG